MGWVIPPPPPNATDEELQEYRQMLIMNLGSTPPSWAILAGVVAVVLTVALMIAWLCSRERAAPGAKAPAVEETREGT